MRNLTRFERMSLEKRISALTDFRRAVTFHLDEKSPTRPCATGWFSRVRCQVCRSPRLLSAACNRCSAQLFVLTHVPKELNLLKLATGIMAESCTGAAEVVEKCGARHQEMFILAAVFLTTLPDRFSEMPFPQSLPARQTHRNNGPLSMPAAVN